MRHRKNGRTLGRPTAHRQALYRNLVTDLIRYEKITTSEAKAREARSLAEKMITLGKEGSLASRRQALAFLVDKKMLSKLFEELAPRYADRPGGYTRIIKLPPRLGDGGALARLELVE